MLLDQNWMVLLQRQNQLAKMMETNQAAKNYGLVLNEEEASLIFDERCSTLKEQKRVEFGEGITSKIIYEFCEIGRAHV